MTRMRTIDRAYEHIKKCDPETCLSRNAFRQMVVTGQIPSIKIGAGKGFKYLCDLDEIEEHLKGPQPMAPEAEQAGKIRRIG